MNSEEYWKKYYESLIDDKDKSFKDILEKENSVNLLIGRTEKEVQDNLPIEDQEIGDGISLSSMAHPRNISYLRNNKNKDFNDDSLEVLEFDMDIEFLTTDFELSELENCEFLKKRKEVLKFENKLCKRFSQLGISYQKFLSLLICAKMICKQKSIIPVISEITNICHRNILFHLSELGELGFLIKHGLNGKWGEYEITPTGTEILNKGIKIWREINEED
jgi:hypothetical protein